MMCRAGSSLALFLTLLAAAAPSPGLAEDGVETKSQAASPQQENQVPLSLTPEQTALLAIQEEGQHRVAEIVQSMQGVPPGPTLDALQAQVVQVKMDTYVRFLTTTAEFARARGDETAALEAERIIEQVRHPQQHEQQEPASPQPREKSPAQVGGQK